MGSAWQTQHRKLMAGRFASVITMMVTTGFDGKQYEMACLPLKKLPGWLMSIHASKVRPDLRENVLAYQDECDDALWAYWNEGHAVNHRGPDQAMTVLGQTIGMDGFHMLGAVVKGRYRICLRQFSVEPPRKSGRRLMQLLAFGRQQTFPLISLTLRGTSLRPTPFWKVSSFRRGRASPSISRTSLRV